MLKSPIGKMDRKIVIQRATATSDAFNEPINSWATHATVWARYEPVRDVERLQGDEIASAITARFTIHHSSDVSDVDTTDRISFDGRIFDISHVKTIGRNEQIEISASARSER
jgi:SPP1 family predicted phage head-tail adaptor